MGKTQRGVVLVMVLWLLVLLEVLVALQAVSARTESELVRNRIDAVKARAAAEAGLYISIDMLASRQGKKESLLRTDGGVYSMDYNTISVSVSVLDEAGKIDINAARPEFIRNLMVSLTGNADKAIQITDAILDWRDVDKVRRESGAEDEEYAAEARPYGAKDEYFDNLEELMLVLGMEDELYEKLTALVTVNTGAEGINPSVAQRSVLLAVPGVNAGQVDEYVQARRRHYTQSAPLPLFPVSDPKYINRDEGRLFTIHVETVTEEGIVERIAVLVRVSEQSSRQGAKPYEILSWNAHDRSGVIALNKAFDNERH
jgi:general secretion pathway protein K